MGVGVGGQAGDELDKVDWGHGALGFYTEAGLDFRGDGEGKGAPQASGGTWGFGEPYGSCGERDVGVVGSLGWGL